MEEMQDFIIRLSCVRDVEDFVSMATSKPYPVYLDDGKHKVNGKSFMEMFCLTLTRPLKMVAQCDEAALQQLLQDAQRFLYQ